MQSAEQNSHSIDPALVDLDAFRTARMEEAWERYLVTRAAAERTGAISDGIAAGRAWRGWLDLFMSLDQRDTLEAAQVAVLGRGRVTR